MKNIGIVYGGSMGDEFGVLGSSKGFFRDSVLLEFLQELEKDRKNR